MTSTSTPSIKRQKKNPMKTVERCLVVDACQQSYKYFHDYLHCKNCNVDTSLVCWLKDCPCKGTAFLFPVDGDQALYAHQVPNHQVSTRIYMNRPERARRSVRKAFKRQIESNDDGSVTSEITREDNADEFKESFMIGFVDSKTKENSSSNICQEQQLDQSNSIFITTTPGTGDLVDDIDPQMLIQVLSELDDDFDDFIDFNNDDQNKLNISSKKRSRDD